MILSSHEMVDGETDHKKDDNLMFEELKEMTSELIENEKSSKKKKRWWDDQFNHFIIFYQILVFMRVNQPSSHHLPSHDQNLSHDLPSCHHLGFIHDSFLDFPVYLLFIWYERWHNFIFLHLTTSHLISLTTYHLTTYHLIYHLISSSTISSHMIVVGSFFFLPSHWPK